MDDTYYGILAGLSLVGVLMNITGLFSNMIGIAMVGISNSLAIGIACKHKCPTTKHEPLDEEVETN